MIRKAKIKDTRQIYDLINYWAKQRAMLGRSLNAIYENIRDFWVFEENDRIVACCALHVIGWQGLGEIKSLAVDKRFHGRGIGRGLVEICLQESHSLGLQDVFALTFVPDFFKSLGFRKIDKKKLPHKIWSDCVECVFFPDCKEIAVFFSLKKIKNCPKDRESIFKIIQDG